MDTIWFRNWGLFNCYNNPADLKTFPRHANQQSLSPTGWSYQLNLRDTLPSMPLNLRRSSQHEQFGSAPRPENQTLESYQKHKPQHGKRLSESQNTPLSVLYQSADSDVRRKLESFQRGFHEWLEPEKHSKSEMISLIVLEQFRVRDGMFRDHSAMRDKLNDCGRLLNDFMEDLSDDCIKEPRMIHVHMQGQEALFSENMLLKDVLHLLNRQESAGTLSGVNSGIPVQILQELPARGEDIVTLSWETTQEHGRIPSRRDQVPSPQVILQGNSPAPEEGGASQDNPGTTRGIDLGTSVSQEQPLEGCSQPDILMEGEDISISTPGTATPKPTSARRHKKKTYLLRKRQKRSGMPPKSHTCQECPKTFTYPSQLGYHQRRHRNERPFVCPTCPKSFFMKSDLHVHQVTHLTLKPFQCLVCDKRFSHRTNLLAHERIHTGEKPYKCSLCDKSYRQSSTYHRHLRWHQRPSGNSVLEKTN